VLIVFLQVKELFVEIVETPDMFRPAAAALFKFSVCILPFSQEGID
jgi:hypothetical protein